MTPEHQKLLSQLFIPYDVTNGIVPKDFGFVKATRDDGLPYRVTFITTRSQSYIDAEKRSNLEAFEAAFPAYLSRLCDNHLRLPERDRLDSIEFNLGSGKIRAPGPIGIYIIDGPQRAAVAFKARYEVVR